MPIDLEAIQRRSEQISDCHDDHCDGDIKALIAEVERLNIEAFSLHEIIARPLEDRQSRIEARIDAIESSRWIPTSERWPEPKTWYVGMIVESVKDIRTGLTERQLRMVCGYPRETPPCDNYPEMTHWQPLEPPKEATATKEPTE